MAPKWFIWFCVFVCSMIGSYVPVIWGGSAFSFSSLLLGGVGGIFGVFVAIKIGNSI
jgi:hypothetical protein